MTSKRRNMRTVYAKNYVLSRTVNLYSHNLLCFPDSSKIYSTSTFAFFINRGLDILLSMTPAQTTKQTMLKADLFIYFFFNETLNLFLGTL